MKYSDQIAEWLTTLGYDQCFFVGGGNIMHLIESLSLRMRCTAVIHEVAAGIAAEYYNESNQGRRALALVTAGPGLTNIITAMAGAYLESRELLVIGGQVKTADLAHGSLRQRGIQEIDGVALAAPVCKKSVLLKKPMSFEELRKCTDLSRSNRKGPVFLEIPLDIQGREYSPESDDTVTPESSNRHAVDMQLEIVAQRVRQAQRPVFLLGGGLERGQTENLIDSLITAGIPVATTWNGADRIAYDNPVYVGRPNTWGQRSANLVIQQADLLVAFGTRLGMQQTGFNWQEFIPMGDVIQIDIDQAELDKGHPKVAMPICADTNHFLKALLGHNLGQHIDWLAYARKVRASVPVVEEINQTREGYLSPYVFVNQLSDLCRNDDIIIPCSSGGAFTVMQQTFRQKTGQIMITNKGLASMGYGLSGAIGAAFAHPARRVILVEGDGGFAQNMQEIGTAQINKLNVKIFVFDDSGYASIRMTQKSYFGGRYIGCDTNTGLGLPNWNRLFAAWDMPVLHIGPGYSENPEFLRAFEATGPTAFVVSIDPEQTYFPKITSQITTSGTMISNPLHRMTPELTPDLMVEIGKFLPK